MRVRVYNPITVTVNVASNANSTEYKYNAASVSGGGSAATSIRDYADVNMAFVPQPMSPAPNYAGPGAGSRCSAARRCGLPH
jgi:hypothetical protein